MKSGCPYCAHKKPFPGETDLGTVYPEIAAEWDYDNNPDKPVDYLPQSNKRKDWICPICTRSYSKKISERTLKKMGCPNCTKPGERSTSQQEQTFVYYLKMKTEALNREKVNGYEIDVYLPELKTGIEYHGEYYHLKRAEKDAEKKKALTEGGIRLITVCCGREQRVSEDTITIQTKFKGNPSDEALLWAIKEVFRVLDLVPPDIDLDRDRSKIYAQYIHAVKANSLAEKYPIIAREWNYELNEGLTPVMFQYGSHHVAYWTYQDCKNDYDMVIYNRTCGGQNCPYCSKPIKRIKVGFNDLATKNPKLADQWHPTRNGEKKPQDVTEGSEYAAWWLCPDCGNEWKAAVYSRAAGKGCPKCFNNDRRGRRKNKK
jgi:very-short-patch-repair endonuclease